MNMFRTSLTLLSGEQCSKVNKKPSLTVPHQVYTVREIIQRSQRGLPVASRPLPYESDDYEPDIDSPEDPFVDKFEAIDTIREYAKKTRAKAKPKKADSEAPKRSVSGAQEPEERPEKSLASEQ